jgi:hypothetical protein
MTSFGTPLSATRPRTVVLDSSVPVGTSASAIAPSPRSAPGHRRPRAGSRPPDPARGCLVRLSDTDRGWSPGAGGRRPAGSGEPSPWGRARARRPAFRLAATGGVADRSAAPRPEPGEGGGFGPVQPGEDHARVGRRLLVTETVFRGDIADADVDGADDAHHPAARRRGMTDPDRVSALVLLERLERAGPVLSSSPRMESTGSTLGPSRRATPNGTTSCLCRTTPRLSRSWPGRARRQSSRPAWTT